MGSVSVTFIPSQCACIKGWMAHVHPVGSRGDCTDCGSPMAVRKYTEGRYWVRING